MNKTYRQFKVYEQGQYVGSMTLGYHSLKTYIARGYNLYVRKTGLELRK